MIRNERSGKSENHLVTSTILDVCSRRNAACNVLDFKNLQINLIFGSCLCSWNSGHEGPVDDPVVIETRVKQVWLIMSWHEFESLILFIVTYFLAQYFSPNIESV